MKIDVLRKTPFAVLVLNAMSSVANKNGGDIISHFNLPTANPEQVEIEVKVNGVVIPFTDEGQIGLNLIMDNYEKAVKEAAVELLKSSRLNGLLVALDNAVWKIEEEIRKTGVENA